MRVVSRETAERILQKACGSREALKKLVSHSKGYDRLTAEQKALVHPLRKIYREENEHMAKAVGYALRNYDINYDRLIVDFEL